MAASNGLAVTSAQSLGIGSARFSSRETSAAAFRYVRLERGVDVHGMAGLAIAAVSLAIRSGQLLHRFQRLVVAHGLATGTAQTLPSGIEPKPLAVWPPAVRTTQSTFSSVTRSSTVPPNLIGVR